MMGKQIRPFGPRRDFTALFAALAVLSSCFFPSSCGKSRPPPSSTEARKKTTVEPRKREEWFWRDRLSVRPVPLPPPVVPEETRAEVASVFRGAEGKAPGTLEKEIRELAALGDDGAFLAGERVRSKDRTARFLAAAVLGRFGGPRAQEPLLAMLRDEWSTAAILAAGGLAAKGEPWIIPRLIKTLGPYPIDFNPYLMMRVTAARALLGLGNYPGVPFLIKILKENTPAEEKERAWDKTQKMAWEKEESLAALSALAGDSFGFRVDSPRPAQAKAAKAFARWWRDNGLRLWREAPPLDDPLLAREIREITAGLGSYQARNAESARFLLRMLGPPVFPYLAEGLKSDAFYVKFHCLDVIGDIASLAGDRARDWTAPVADLLGDKAPAIRAQACRAIGILRGKGVLSRLEGLLLDTDEDVRLKAVEAMGRIGGPKSALKLKALLAKEKDPQMRVEILAALVRTDPSAVKDFIKELEADDLGRQDRALQKVIELTGDDFGFPLGGSAAERRKAVGEIAAALKTLKR